MTNARGALLVSSLLATSVLTALLGINDPLAPWSFSSRFLIWNLFLAWIPLLLAAAFATARRGVAMLLFGAGWLAFLPNAPYLMTDLVHLGGGENLWRHVLQFGFAAWTGILLGVVSMLLVHRRMERAYGARAGWLTVAVSVVLCAVGVVIGRFQRWNSWDLLTRPDEVIAATLAWLRSPMANIESTGVAFAVAAFFGLAYVAIWSLTSARVRPAAGA